MFWLTVRHRCTRRMSRLIVDNSERLVEHARIARIDPALIIAAPRYGLRYGFSSATGNFQRLRGRPPLVSPLKSCVGRSFTAVTRVQIPSGTPTKSSTCRNRSSRRGTHCGTVLFASDQAKHLSVRRLLLVRHRFIVDVHRHSDGVVAQQPLNDLRIAVILPQQCGIGMA
jgi:hypothetical protein